jgi:hypothetical protein
VGTWGETFGESKDWSTGCPLCLGSQFFDAPNTSSIASLVGQKLWTEASTARCPCWMSYMTMSRLWGQEFPKGYLKFNWDGSWPINNLSVEQQSKWNKWKCQDSYAWDFASEDENVIRYWVDHADDVDKRGLSIFLHGAKGTGKSSLATTLAKEYTKRRGIDATGVIDTFNPRFLVCDELYESLSSRDWRSKDVANVAMRSDLLVLDDFRLNYTGFTQVEYAERLHSFLQYRSGCNLPTIITANKITEGQDFKSNCVSDFLGITEDVLPKSFGKFRFVELTNKVLRSEPEW